MLPLVGLTQCRSSAEDTSAFRAVALQVTLLPRSTSASTEQVILVALDGVRWQDVFLGTDPELSQDQQVPSDLHLHPQALLPNLYGRVAARGVVIGAPGYGPGIAASGPSYISLPGYMEMLTGRAAGWCDNNECGRVAYETLPERFLARGAEPERVAVVSSWHQVDLAASRDVGTMLVSAGARGGHTRGWLRRDPLGASLLRLGEHASSLPGGPGYRPDAYTAPLALHVLRTLEPKFLFIGLGDTDEYGHANDYQGYLRALRYADDFVGSLLDTLQDMGEYGETTTVVVTTDHGRARDFSSHGEDTPESARVWLMAAGGGVPTRGLVQTSRRYRLADIAPTVVALLGWQDAGAGGIVEVLPVAGAGESIARY